MAYQYKCPRCGDPHHIDVTVTTDARIVQHENGGFESDLDEAFNRDKEWDDDSPASCRSCGKDGTMKEFVNPDYKEDEGEEDAVGNQE